eukprot:gene7753-935_t
MLPKKTGDLRAKKKEGASGLGLRNMAKGDAQKYGCSVNDVVPAEETSEPNEARETTAQQRGSRHSEQTADSLNSSRLKVMMYRQIGFQIRVEGSQGEIPEADAGQNAFAVLDGQPEDRQPEPDKPPKPSSAPQAKTPAKLPKDSKALNEHRARIVKKSIAKLKAEEGKLKNPLVWIDLEMTGLEPDKDTILEIAVIVSDGNLSIILEGPSLVIHHDESVLKDMNAWCKEHHGKSGLSQKVLDSTVSMAEAEEQVLDFISTHIKSSTAQLAGNTIHMDRSFLLKYMPDLIEHLNYRVVDVSSIKELARRWYPSVYKKAPRKVMAHTALSDIWESIEELQYYRSTIFIESKG